MKVSAATGTAFEEDVITDELLDLNNTFNLIKLINKH